jgi:DNA repair exonuclease SbcCD nuclease subunit
MKYCIVGDQHFRFQLPYAPAVKDGRKQEWRDVLDKIIEVAETSDAVILLGDNLNSRHNHSSVNRAFVDFIKEVSGDGQRPVHIIAGNHERFGKETAIDFLKNTGICHVYTEPATVRISGNKVTFLPFMTPGTLGVADLEEANKSVLEHLKGGDILFHHHVVGGSVGFEGYLNELVLPREILEDRYNWVIGGHIHGPQSLSAKTYVTGNIFTHGIGEYEKFVWTLDTEQKSMEQIPLPVRGIYNYTWGEAGLDKIPDKSIVKVTVTEPGTIIEDVKKALSRFDAYVVIEKYPHEREKVTLGETEGMDLSLENLIKVYSEVRDVKHSDLQDAMKLLEESQV